MQKLRKRVKSNFCSDVRPRAILCLQNDVIIWGQDATPCLSRFVSTKKEIVAAVAEKLGITQLAAKEVVHSVLGLARK